MINQTGDFVDQSSPAPPQAAAAAAAATASSPTSLSFSALSLLLLLLTYTHVELTSSMVKTISNSTGSSVADRFELDSCSSGIR